MAEYLKCAYDKRGCPGDPIYYIILGCINHHMVEGGLCLEHFREWYDKYKGNQWMCAECREDVIDYEVCASAQLKEIPLVRQLIILCTGSKDTTHAPTTDASAT